MNGIYMQAQLAAQYQQERRREGATERALRAAQPRPLISVRRTWILHFAPRRSAIVGEIG
jgi:hypothetical protein